MLARAKSYCKTFDWETFMNKHDIIWDDLKFKGGNIDGVAVRIPKSWGESGLLGNGMIGAAIYKKNASSMMWELGRNDVESKFMIPDIDTCIPRIGIGNVNLITTGNIERETMRTALYNAEVSGTITTSGGSIVWRSISHADENIIVIDIHTKGDEQECSLQFEPGSGNSLKAWSTPEMAVDEKYIPPKPHQHVIDGITVSVQEYNLEDGSTEGEFAVAYLKKEVTADRIVLYLSIENTPYSNEARYNAAALVKSAAEKDLESYIQEHREWWHNYYQQSLIEIPDAYWESFYWMQMYKLGCCARKNINCVIDNQGIWATKSRWPGTWWNLNVQLSYSPLFKANRLDQAESIVNALSDQEEALTRNAYPVGIQDGMYIGRSSGRDMTSPMPDYEEIMALDRGKGPLDKFELGNLTWALHSVYRYYRSLMDDEFFKNRLYPLLKKVVNVYLRLAYKKQDGKWHLPKTTSPEYPGPINGTSYPANDTNYDLSLLRWALKTLLEASQKVGLKDPMESVWQDYYENLADYPVDETGYLIGADLPYSMSHRHYSHLLQFFPLHIISEDNPEERELAEKSMRHWMSYPESLKGYSYTGSSCMAATLGDGNKAIELLDGLKGFALPNTLYAESGGPVIETPLASAESIHYMLMHCHNNVVKIFPAVPDKWHNVSFHNLLAEGAFTVSAVREEGHTKYVYIRSNAGHNLVCAPNMPNGFTIEGNRDFKVISLGCGKYSIDIQKGEEILLLQN